MSRDRPLVVVFEMVNKSIGGVQTVTASVLAQLFNQFRFVVIDPYQNPEFAAMMREAGFEVASLGPAPMRRYIGGKHSPLRIFYVLRRAPWLLATTWRLRRWIKQQEPDVIFFNQLPAVRLFARALSSLKVGMVFHAHGTRSADDIGPRTARFLSERFERLLAVSKITARFLTEAGVEPAKVEVVYNAVDVEQVRKEAERAGPPLPERPRGAVVFVHAAALMRGKKAQHLGVEALARVPRDLNAHLWICGDVPPGGEAGYRDELQTRASSLGIADRVHLLGWRKDVARVMNHADVSILPSRDHSESFGMVLAEAMALDKACIGSNMGGVPEVIEDGVTGLICEPTVEDLAKAMQRLAESADLRREMGEAGRRRVEEHFALGRQVAQVADALHAAAGRSDYAPDRNAAESRKVEPV